MFKIIAAAALAATTFAASANTVNLVQDGSFESTIVAQGLWTTVATTTTVTAGDTLAWTSTHGIEIRNDIAGQSYAGSNFVELDTDQNSTISQTLATQVGQAYLLTFYVQDRAGDAASADGISYTVGGIGGAIAGGTSANWTEYSYWFVADSAATALTFSAGGASNGYGSSLDNISVTAVPEANTMAMLAAGLGLLGLARRRARK